MSEALTWTGKGLPGLSWEACLCDFEIMPTAQNSVGFSFSKRFLFHSYSFILNCSGIPLE